MKTRVYPDFFLESVHQFPLQIVQAVRLHFAGRRSRHAEALRDFAAGHDLYAVAQHNGLFQTVRYKKDADAHLLPQVNDLPLHVGTREVVQRSKWLVHQQQHGMHHQRPRQRYALLHAAGELPRQRLFKAFQADHADHFPHVAFAGRASGQAEGRVARHVQPGHQPRFLKHHGGFEAGRQLDFASVAGFQPCHQLQKRRLATAALSHQHGGLSRRNAQTQAAQYVQRPTFHGIAFFHISQFNSIHCPLFLRPSGESTGPAARR